MGGERDMAEPTSRIERASSNREQQPQGAPNRAKTKRRPNENPPVALAGPIEPAEPDADDKHELDTMA